MADVTAELNAVQGDSTQVLAGHAHSERSLPHKVSFLVGLSTWETVQYVMQFLEAEHSQTVANVSEPHSMLCTNRSID